MMIRKIFAGSLVIAIIAAVIFCVSIFIMILAITTLDFSLAEKIQNLMTICAILIGSPSAILFFLFVAGQAKKLFGCHEIIYRVWRFILIPVCLVFAGWQALLIKETYQFPQKSSFWWLIMILFFLPILAGIIRKRVWR